MSALQSLAVRRFGIVVVSAASLIVCCALAWWQWERYESGGGSVQNLGYVLQWPLFGLFPAFVFLRMRRLRRLASAGDPDADKSAEPVADEVTMSQLRSRWLYRTPQRTMPADTPGEPDDALAEYNRYLAELNQRDTST